jgi:2-oxoisovalerate dehydrogenase E1 component
MKNEKEKYFEEIKKAILIREVENSFLTLFGQGKLNGTVHTCIGQEFTGVFVSKYLTEDDHMVTNHRGHGHYISKTGDVKGLVAELLGKEIGCSGGMGGSQHLYNKNFLSNGIQGGMVPIACGIAKYYKLQKQKNISVAFIGDGTLGEGIIYETFNIAAKKEYPLLIVLESNGMAQSTSTEQTFSGDMQKRIEGFGIEYIETTTDDLFDLDIKVKKAITQVRDENKPTLINIKTNRLNSHSKGDDNREESKVKQLKDKDLLNKIYEEDSFKDYIKDTKSEILGIINDLENETITKSIKKKEKLILAEHPQNFLNDVEKGRYSSLINETLNDLLEQNNDLILLGEDIEDKNIFNPKEYGGAFKVTKDLSIKYPNQVFNTPISEAAITGISSGYVLAGGKAILEIMFGDFTTLIFDQLLQHASKFEDMYAGKIHCPLIVRTPMGGRRGYGPTHSQSLEKFFLGIPNLSVIALNHRISPRYVYDTLISSFNNPCLVIENKILYTVENSKSKLAGYNYSFNKKSDTMPNLMISPKDYPSELTILCYGGSLIEIEKVAEKLCIEDEVFVDIICPTLISEISVNEIITSLQITKKLLIVEEGNNFASWSSEVIAKISEKQLNSSITRISNNEIIPSSFDAELNTLPSVNKIYKTALNIIDND